MKENHKVITCTEHEILHYHLTQTEWYLLLYSCLEVFVYLLICFQTPNKQGGYKDNFEYLPSGIRLCCCCCCCCLLLPSHQEWLGETKFFAKPINFHTNSISTSM